MKLYLCGGGSFKEVSKALLHFSKGLDRSKPILYVPLAMEKEKYRSCYEWFASECQKMNFPLFEMVTSSEELSQKDFANYSGIFIGGGNTYKLLHEIKQNSIYENIIDYLNNGGSLFAGSAGAIIFGNDINSCLLDDENTIGLKDTKGFNFLNDYSILCHLKNKNFKKNCKYLIEYSKTNKVIYLPEEDVLLINDKKVSLIGNKKYIIFKNGKYAYHNFANLKKDMII